MTDSGIELLAKHTKEAQTTLQKSGREVIDGADALKEQLSSIRDNLKHLTTTDEATRLTVHRELAVLRTLATAQRQRLEALHGLTGGQRKQAEDLNRHLVEMTDDLNRHSVPNENPTLHPAVSGAFHRASVWFKDNPAAKWAIAGYAVLQGLIRPLARGFTKLVDEPGAYLKGMLKAAAGIVGLGMLFPDIAKDASKTVKRLVDGEAPLKAGETPKGMDVFDVTENESLLGKEKRITLDGTERKVTLEQRAIVVDGKRYAVSLQLDATGRKLVRTPQAGSTGGAIINAGSHFFFGNSIVETQVQPTLTSVVWSGGQVKADVAIRGTPSEAQSAGAQEFRQSIGITKNDLANYLRSILHANGGAASVAIPMSGSNIIFTPAA